MHQIDQEIFNLTRAQIRVLEPVNSVTPFQDSTMGPFQTFGMAILTLEDEEGNIGEAPVYSSYSHILETCLLPILFHSPEVPYGSFFREMYWSIRNEGFRGAAAALLGQVDMALHDLAARRRQMPLQEYLGACRHDAKMYGSGGGTNYTLPELENEIAYFMEAGVDCYKMKVGKDFGTNMVEDAARVKFVRQILGNSVRLAVDANQIWSAEQSLRFLDLTSGLDLAWFEEPVHSADLIQIESLCSRTAMPIAYGESERTSKTFPALVNAGVSCLQPVPTQMMSVQEWMEVRDLARQHGLSFSSGGYSLYTASLMATAGDECMVEYLYSLMHGLGDYFSVRPLLKQGRFVLPPIDGLPLRVDWDYCRRQQKIIRQLQWTRQKVREYSPVVTM